MPGDGLDARIAGGGLPLREALAIARDVADALESAHEQGIVHRDMKPANLKLASDGRVKVLDFGLARAAEAVTGGRDTAATTTGMTQAGTIVGTASYMSPEQARGEPVDRRTDIWAFGCVLYEMLSGRRVFDGRSAVDVIGAVLRSEPDLELLPDATPVQVRHLIDRCLRKDPRHRLRDIGDARLVIEDVLGGAPAAAAAQTRGRPNAWYVHATWAVAALALAVATGLVANRLPGRSAPPALRKLEVLVADPIFSGHGGGRDAGRRLQGRRAAGLVLRDHRAGVDEPRV